MIFVVSTVSVCDLCQNQIDKQCAHVLDVLRVRIELHHFFFFFNSESSLNSHALTHTHTAIIKVTQCDAVHTTHTPDSLVKHSAAQIRKLET